MYAIERRFVSPCVHNADLQPQAGHYHQRLMHLQVPAWHDVLAEACHSGRKGTFYLLYLLACAFQYRYIHYMMMMSTDTFITVVPAVSERSKNAAKMQQSISQYSRWPPFFLQIQYMEDSKVDLVWTQPVAITSGQQVAAQCCYTNSQQASVKSRNSMKTNPTNVRFCIFPSEAVYLSRRDHQCTGEGEGHRAPR
jgi:hypothetical protein